MKLLDKYPVERKLKWVAPEEGGAPLLTMPNIPKPLHAVNPRLIMGDAAWAKVRKKAYYDAGYRSEISGELCATPGSLHAHEVYDINYVTGVCTFKRVCAITPLEHVYFIHSGRAITMWKNHNPLYTTTRLLTGVENGFRLIHDWNKRYPHREKLKAYQTFLDYLKYPELTDPMEKLIAKYEIEFWGEDTKRACDWGDWKLVIIDPTGAKTEYPTPYKDYQAWEEAMEERAKCDTIRQLNNPFAGGAFDEVDKLLNSTIEKGEEKKVILISDIDGVLADCNHRLKYLKNKDYETFYSDEEISQDAAIEPGCDLVRHLMQMAKETIFITGRRESCRTSTVKWLSDNDIHGYRMICRKDNDWRPSQTVKKEEVKKLLEDIPQDSEVFYIDDKPENVHAVCSLPFNISGLLFEQRNRVGKDNSAPFVI